MDEYSWASAVGRIRIKEKEFLSRSELTSAVEGEGLSGALGALRDTSYGSYLGGLATSSEDTGLFVPALEAALNGAYAYAVAVSPDPLLITAFRARHDFHNLKVVAKSAYLGRDGEEQAVSRVGNLDPTSLWLAPPKAESSGDVPLPSLDKVETLRRDIDIVTAAVLSARQEAMALVDSQSGSMPPDQLALLVDSLIDAAYYGWASSVFKKSGHEGLREFISAEVDVLNLKVSMRASRLGIRRRFFKEMPLPGGNVPKESLVEALESRPSAIAAAFRDTPWESLAASGAASCARKESLSRWEKACDNALMAVIRKARYYSLGPEPVYGFIFGKESEARNLRVILSGKQSAVSNQEISERLRDPYV